MSLLLVGRRTGAASALLMMLAGTLIGSPSRAEVRLRVQSHPITAPIDAFVQVTEGGESVTGLTPADFAVTLDGAPVDQFTLTLPPNQDSAQKVSVVIVIHNFEWLPTRDYSPLLEQLATGDFVSVVKYGADFENRRLGGLFVLPFTEIDGGAGSEQIRDFIQDRPQLNLTGARFLYEGLIEGMSQMAVASATLPAGPKAIVTVECCSGRRSLSDVVALANAGSVSIFNMVNNSWDGLPDVVAEQRALSTSTGGIRVRRLRDTSAMGSWLRDGYRISIPHTAIDDCNRHNLAVTVGGESRSVAFSRCDTTPEDFSLRDLYDADVSKHVRARAVITGIETAVPVRVQGGQYSVGCTSPFTSEPGRIRPGQAICVRHTTAASGGLEVATLLTVGSVSDWFISTTAFPAAPPSP